MSESSGIVEVTEQYGVRQLLEDLYKLSNLLRKEKILILEAKRVLDFST